MSKTLEMRRDNNVLTHSWQGQDKRLLFVCSAGILRSATAARVYSQKYNTRCAGSKNFALIPVTENLLLWADEIVFMNPENYFDVCRQFDIDGLNFRTLGVPDEYNYMEPELIELLEKQYEPL